jgi:hypothetical protein
MQVAAFQAHRRDRNSEKQAQIGELNRRQRVI